MPLSFKDIIERFKSHKVTDIVLFLCFSLVMTLIVSSQNFFFQRVIENGISKKDIIRVYGHVEKRYDKYQIIVNSLKVLNDN